MTINGTAALRYADVAGSVQLSRSLYAGHVHKIKITLLQGQSPTTLQFKGVRLDQGGRLKSCELHNTDRMQGEQNAGDIGERQEMGLDGASEGKKKAAVTTPGEVRSHH